MSAASWWKRVRRDREGKFFFWLLGIATGFAIAAACNEAAGKSFVEMIAVLVGAAAPVFGAVWISREADRKAGDRRRLPLANALIAIHNAAMRLDRSLSEALARKSGDAYPGFAQPIEELRTAHADLDAFRALADPFDYDVTVTIRRADEAYARLGALFERLLNAPRYVNSLAADTIYRDAQKEAESLMDRTGSAATDLLSITLRRKVQVGLGKRDRS